ncbi:MAG: exodeoxyribonuclease I [Wenzhouxiangellaceae bacterium]|nr:exodeoxyribonuclease I [Wenzhouxiangellaceae bacterium]
MSDGFLWHDYETFGADPRRDRPCQFAARPTDTDLRPCDEPVVLYCAPGDDVLPVPQACRITGITPQLARERGEPEYAFARAIHELMAAPGTCSVGFNNFRFDDELTRFLFWRNFLDPYRREYANGNSRFDLIDLLRLARALRPDGMQWPARDDGATSFRLEDLAEANGCDVSSAHDALADVDNTLALARRLRDAQPRLWEWALQLRAKHRVESLLERGDVLLHASARFPAAEGAIAPILPLARHPEIPAQWLVWNLRHDPEPFRSLDPELLDDLAWTPADDLPEGLQRLPVKWVRSNRCPMLSPMNTLDSEARARSGIDPQAATRHASRLTADADFVDRVLAAAARPAARTSVDPEVALYDGFIPRSDEALRNRLGGADADEIADVHADGGEPFADPRLNEMLFRFVARHRPDRLDAEGRARWRRHRRRVLVDDPDLASVRITEYRELVAALAEEGAPGPLVRDLVEWPEKIGMNDLQRDE